MVKPIIPQALQPGRGQQVKPPTVAEQKLIKKYGSVERGRAIQSQQTTSKQVLPEGSLGKSEIATQLTIAQQEYKQIQLDKVKAYEVLKARHPGENIGSSQLRDFNRVWSIKAETVNRKVNALRNISSQVGEGYISKTSLQQYIAGSVSGVERDLRVAKSKAGEREEIRADTKIYDEVINTFGTTLDSEEIIQLTPSQARVVGVSQQDIENAWSGTGTGTSTTVGTYTTKKVKIPTGWWNEEMIQTLRDFKSENPQLTDSEIITSSGYKSAVQVIASKPENRESIKRFAERRNLLGEGYGEDIVKVSTTESRAAREQKSIQLSEMAKAARYRQTFLGQAFDVSEQIGVSSVVRKYIAPPVRSTLSGIGMGLTSYAEATPITKVGETINLPITSQGIDITKATGDILSAYKYEKQSEITGKKNIENKSKFLSSQTDKLNSATTQEEVDKIIKDIKNKGIKVEKITSETGELSYKFNIPIPKALQDKLDASTLASFFTSASGVAYGETFAGLTLSNGLESTAGKIGTIAGETAPYLFGGFGGALIAEPFIEKGLYGEKGELREYAIEHPFESLLLGAMVVGGAYGAVKKIKVAKQYKNYIKAKEELKKLQEYYNTIQPSPVGKGASYLEGYSGKVTKTKFIQLKKLNIEKRLLDQAVNIKFSAAYQEFSKTVPTMSKTSKGLYQINEFGKTIKFFNNQITITIITKEGKAITITLAARSNRPLKTIEAFIKYGRDKRVVTGFTAGDFTSLSMGRYWGGKVRDTRTFIAKETTKEGAKGLRSLEIRETFGAEKYTDDFAELFGISPKVSETKFQTIKDVKKPLAFGEISITKGDNIVTLFTGTKQPVAGVQFTKAEVGIGNPIFTKLVKEQAGLKANYIKPKVFDFGFADDVITKTKPGAPRPDVLAYDFFGTSTSLVKEQKVVKTTKDIIAAQEVATRSFGITDIRTRAPPPPKAPPVFVEVLLGESRFEGLGTFDSGRLKVTTKEIDQTKIKVDTAGSLIYGTGIKGGTKEKVIGVEDGTFDSIAPITRAISEPAIKPALKITPIQRTALKQSQVLKEEVIGLTDFGVPSTPTKGDFFFPAEIPSFRIIPDLDRKKKKFAKGQRIGYNVFVKSKGKSRKMTSVPHTKSGAKDIGARIVDNTTSAMFHIEPIKQTKVIKGKRRAVIQRFEQDELRKGDGYFNSAAGKFRNFMIRRGNKVQMNNKWIEKKTKRNDTIGEQKGLTVSAFKARQTKVRLGLPTRRTKKKSTSKQRFRL